MIGTTTAVILASSPLAADWSATGDTNRRTFEVVIHLEKDAARFLKLSPRTLQRYRKDGTARSSCGAASALLATPTTRLRIGWRSTLTQASWPNAPQAAS